MFNNRRILEITPKDRLVYLQRQKLAAARCDSESVIKFEKLLLEIQADKSKWVTVKRAVMREMGITRMDQARHFVLEEWPKMSHQDAKDLAAMVWDEGYNINPTERTYFNLK